MASSSLLIIISEPVARGRASAILNRVTEGLSAWNNYTRGFLNDQQPDLDLNTEIRNFLNANVAAKTSDTGGTVLQHVAHNLRTEILVNPTVHTLQASLASFLTFPSIRKLIVHAGTAFAGTGSWILQDGTLSFHDFARILHRADVTTALTEITKDSALVVSCHPEGEWNDQGVKHHGLDKLGKITVGVLSGHANIDASCAADLQAYLEKFAAHTKLEDLMPASTVVGSVRFRRPTLHIFPAGQGEAALFGVSGFTILFDGGFTKKTCFWDFLRHVDRVDALLISRINSNNILGISSFIDRLANGDCHPKLGYVFGNMPSLKVLEGANGDAGDPLLVSLHNESARILDYLDRSNLKPHPCSLSISSATKHPEPLTLYQKVGQGRLDMYVLNPTKDSKELTEFIDSWKKGIHRLAGPKFSTKPGSTGGEYAASLLDQTSIAVLLIWHPADPEEQITRVLYPGSCPQEKILSGLEKLKHLDFLKHPTCTGASLQAGPGKTTVASKKPATSKPVESTKAAASLASPKSLASTVAKAVTNAASAVAAAIPAAMSAMSAISPMSPKAADENHHHQHHHHHAEPSAPAMAPMEQLHIVELQPPVESLLDKTPSPLELPAAQRHDHSLLQDFAQSPPLEPEHISVAIEHPPHQPTSPLIESENFIHREQLEAVESQLAGSQREQAGFSVEAEPMRASPFETVDVCHLAEPGVLRLSNDQLYDNFNDRSAIDVVQEPSPVVGDQKSVGHLMDAPPEALHDFGFNAPVEPHAHQHESFVQLDEADPRSLEKHGHVSPGIPIEVSGAPPSPRSLQRSLNPDAPVFIPKTSDLSPSLERAFGTHPLLPTSPMDPFSENKGVGDGHAEPHGFDNYRNGGTSLLDDSAWSTEATAASPKRAGDPLSSPFGDEPHHHHHHHHEQPSPNSQRKSLDEMMTEWGKPLGLPMPPVLKQGASNATAAAAPTKPKANGPAPGAAKEPAKPSSASTATAAKRPATTATTTNKPAASSASAKTTPPTEKSTASTAAKKPTGPPAAAPPKAGPTAARPSAPATKTATAKPTSAAAAKSPASPRPPTTTAAPKTTAAPAKAAPAAKKPGPPLASYYVDLAYIPHQGNPHYCNADFFKHVRSKHYVLSALHPSKEILESLLTGKKAWNLPEEEVTLIPTYDSDTLSLWMGLHKDELASESIDVAPSCIRCTVNLEEHDGAKCAAYRLEL